MKVAIVGAGRIGSLLANAIPAGSRKVIISRQRGEASHLADEVGGVASEQLSAVRGCRVVFLAVPGPAVASLVRDMVPHLAENAYVVNMAPDVSTSDLSAEFPRTRLVAAKLVGHAREMSQGIPGLVVLDQVDDDAEDLLRSLLEGLGPVVRHRESLVPEATTAIAEAMVQAHTQLTSRLTAMGIDRHMAAVAITAAGPGILRSLTEGDVGPFMQGVIDKLRTGAPVEPRTSH